VLAKIKWVSSTLFSKIGLNLKSCVKDLYFGPIFYGNRPCVELLFKIHLENFIVSQSQAQIFLEIFNSPK